LLGNGSVSCHNSDKESRNTDRCEC
jgi:hypothetical protein